MANIIYDKFMEEKAKGNIDWINDDLQVCLLLSTYTPSKSDDYYANINSHEIASGGGYTTGGKNIELGGDRSVTISSHQLIYDGDNVEWLSSTITARYAVIYHAITGVLIACFDFLTNKVSSNETFKIEWSPSGIFTEEQAT